MNVYETCPVLRSQHFTLRLVEMADAPDLLAVYSNEETIRLCNSDSCTYGFRLENMQQAEACIAAWLREYAKGYFVRWAIVAEGRAIGTVELFHRESADAFNHHGLLRLDVLPEWENPSALKEMLTLLHQHAYALFHCSILATKAPSFAHVRQEALRQCGYMPSVSMLMGPDGTAYGDYWVRMQDTLDTNAHLKHAIRTVPFSL